MGAGDGLGGANSWGEPARLTSRLSSDSKSTSETGPGPESLVVLLTEEVETVVTESSVRRWGAYICADCVK